MSEDEFPEAEGVTLIATDFTVSASEKTSTGQYENYNPHLTIEGKIPMTELDEASRAAVKQELLSVHGDLQAVLQKAVGNRHAEQEWEDWTFGDEGPEVKSADEVEADGGDDE